MVQPCIWFKEEQSHLSMVQTAQGRTCYIMEKPHTGLDKCPRILLSCFRARNSDCRGPSRSHHHHRQTTSPPVMIIPLIRRTNNIVNAAVCVRGGTIPPKKGIVNCDSSGIDPPILVARFPKTGIVYRDSSGIVSPL